MRTCTEEQTNERAQGLCGSRWTPVGDEVGPAGNDIGECGLWTIEGGAYKQHTPIQEHGTNPSISLTEWLGFDVRSRTESADKYNT